MKMFEPRVKLDRELYDRLKKVAAAVGYATVDEFIIHLLDKAADDAEEAESEDAIRQRLQGLGYIE